jgi:hypothetical protein
MKIANALAACLLVAGCFTSDGSLYGGITPLRPFHDGAVTTRDKDGKTAHMALRGEAAGVYRFTVTDKGDDFGEGYLLRFFPLSGAAANTVIFEAVELCLPRNKNCTPPGAASERLYGLARLSQAGAEVLSPQCSKDNPLAKRPGVTADAYGSCTFKSRAELERGLRALAATNWKADAVYRFVAPGK